MAKTISYASGKALVSLSVSCLMAWSAVAQQIPKPIDSGKIIQEANALHDKQKYEEAVALYLQVHESDTNYATAQSELALSYNSQKKYDQALQAANRSLEQDPPSLLHALLNKANALSDLDRKPEALKLFNEILKKYPYGKMGHYNKAVLLEKEGKLQEAMEEVQQELQINFRHASSHLLLGKLAAKQEQTAHATLSLITYLLIEPASGRSNANLVYLENLLAGTLTGDKETFVKPFTPNTAFKELDLLLNSRVALTQKYKAKVNFNAALVKQVQLLFEKAAYTANSGDFWMEHYIPMVASLQKQDLLVPFTYTILASTGHKDVNTWFKRNKSKMDKFWPLIRTELNNAQEFITVNKAGKSVKMKAWITDGGLLQAISSIDNKAADQKSGHWTFYNGDGGLQAEGNYKNNNKTGLWKYYDKQGRLVRIENFNDKGELEGEYKEYFSNGHLSVAAKHKAGKVEGDVKLFYPCGTVKEVFAFKDGAKHGPGKVFQPTGELEMEYTYQNGEFEGKVKGYFFNGKPQYITSYKAGKKEGEYIDYYENGAVYTKGQYSNGEHTGEWISYHPNGKVKEQGLMANGKRSGTWKEYFEDGTISEETEYNAKGEINNLAKSYDEDGKLFQEVKYQNGLPLEAIYYDKSGTVVSKSVAKGNKLDLKAHNPKGVLVFTKRFVSGKADGEAKYFYENGTVKAVQHFKNGVQQGLAQEYFADGKLKTEVEYKEDQPEGYYREYYRNGQIQLEGWMVKGQRDGEWRSYHTNGKPNTINFYVNGELNGLDKEYASTGSIAYINKYDLGTNLSVTQLDSTGKILHTIDYIKPDSVYRLNHPNGKARILAPMVCGRVHGKLEWKDYHGKSTGYSYFKNGRRDGAYKGLYPNGKVKATAYYQNGNLMGDYHIYAEDGKIAKRNHYKYDQKDSTWIRYHENGKVEAELTYKNDKINGLARYYDTQGMLMIEKFFDNFGLVYYRYELPDGKLSEPQYLDNYNGKVQSYYRNGKLAVEETYRNGSQEGKSTHYYSNGKPYLIRHYEFGEYHGVYEEYWDNGKLKLREQYEMGREEGLSQWYRQDGTTEKTETYVAGEKNGPAKYFNKSGKLTQTKIYWNDNEYSVKKEKGV